MLSTAKILGLSAVLSAGLVTALEFPRASETIAPKAFSDRLVQEADAPSTTLRLPAGTASFTVSRAADGSLRKGDAAPAPRCEVQAWPNIERACLSAADGTPARQAVRTITVETREAPNTSTLTRLPRTAMAQR